MVEQLTLNQRVQGSSPCRPTRNQSEGNREVPFFVGSDGRASRIRQPKDVRDPGFESLQTEQIQNQGDNEISLRYFGWRNRSS